MKNFIDEEFFVPNYSKKVVLSANVLFQTEF